MAASICSDNFTIEIISDLDCTFTLLSEDDPLASGIGTSLSPTPLVNPDRTRQIQAVDTSGSGPADGSDTFGLAFSYIMGTGSTSGAVFVLKTTPDPLPAGVQIQSVFFPSAPRRGSGHATAVQVGHVTITVDIDSAGNSPEYTPPPNGRNQTIDLRIGMDTNGLANAPNFP